jgi:serine-type D-Ala-D-Ala carboxypeptidase (penicillin-binding protein 5/6)
MRTIRYAGNDEMTAPVRSLPISEEQVRHCYPFAIVISSLLITTAPAAALPGKTVPAKAAVVMDAYGTVLYAKFPNAKLAPASTVKLVTAMVALDHLKPDDAVRISWNASRVKTIPPGICPDEEMTVADLLHLALMKSINSSAVALAEATAGSEAEFTVLMNRKAQELGARDTLFANASGLPKGGIQYSTASDLALIMKAALSYPLIREILATKECTIRTPAGREIFVESSNHLLWQEQAMIVGKTGYTGNARHCFVGMVTTESGPVFTAVLGARSRTSLWKATSMLAEIGAHPERANLLETRYTKRGSGKTNAKKSKSSLAGTQQESIGKDIQISRLLRISSQHLGND